MDSKIHTAKSQNYTSILQDYIRNSRFNTSETPKPTLILTPTDESQVGVMVRCAKVASLHLRIRSGGHDLEGLSYTSGVPFAILDLSSLRSIQIDLTNQTAPTAWVQSGATLGELYYQISKKSETLAFPAGVCPTVGVGGHITGGGYGNMMRKHGLTVDNLVDARIVDTDGRIRDRKSMGEDLFWAIRGGGAASFGVVLSYKINLVTIPKTVTVFDIIKTVEENASGILHQWQKVAYKMDKELFIRVSLASLKETARASFLAMYLGNCDKLVETMTSQFPELGLQKNDCKEMSWIRAVLMWAGFPKEAPETALLARNTGPSAFKMKSDYVTSPIPLTGLDGLLQRVRAERGKYYVKFNPYGGRMSEILATEAAFPHREGIIYKIQYVIVWNETGRAAEAYHLGKIREMYDYMEAFVTKNPRRAYLNYGDIDIGRVGNGTNGYEEARVYGVKYFGENFERLVRVKSVVDPSNFFRNEQSIPPMMV
ncbi:berberine bridge enzyme-like 21 [Salvia hispanica]|uniref:berberine bridge enzyme-like 21 n=1 Tax=Salvia hispanica TaxID=49212 RepID=UPI002009059E|nr:berberine bridge enzyme-like 21 [Salvia hispanica]